MKMNSKISKKIFFALSLGCVLSATAGSVFFKTVVLPAVPTNVEKAAARELVKHLEQLEKRK